MTKAKERVLLAAALLGISLVLLPKFWNGFVYDDVFVFVVSDTIHSWSNIPSFFTHNAMYVTGRVDPMVIDTYRPLTLTTFALDSLWSGRDPLGYHLTNLVLHLAVVGLVYAVARSAMSEQSRRFAWIAAAWFGLSPWLGEAHIWINGRSDPLCTLFVLGFLVVWDRGIANKDWRLHGAAAGLLFASLLCKEVAIGILPALWLWPALRRSYPSARGRFVPLLSPVVGVGAYLCVRLVVLGGLKSHQDTAHALEAVSNFGLLFFDSLRAVLLPTPPYLRSLVESYVGVAPALRWAALFAALGIIGLAISMRRRQPLLAWSIVFFAGTLAPASVITTLGWPGFGRYLYLPFAGLCIGVVDAIATALQSKESLWRPRTRRIVALAVAAYLAGSAFLLHRFVYDFRDDGALYGAAIDGAPHHAYGHAYLGMSLINHGHADVAVDYLREAIRLQPFEPKYRLAMGQALVRSGQREEAAALAESWLRDGRLQDAPQYLLVIVDAVESTDPRRAVAAALSCVRVNPEWGTCLERLRWLANDHVRAAEYRDVIREQLALPPNRSIVERVESVL
jgi:tetratricopeptide (TPR) repeat protein